MNFNEGAIDNFKNELKTELKNEIVKALKPHFKILEKHMGRHCKEIQKLESTVKSHGRILKSHGAALRRSTKEQ